MGWSSTTGATSQSQLIFYSSGDMTQTNNKTTKLNEFYPLQLQSDLKRALGISALIRALAPNEARQINVPFGEWIILYSVIFRYIYFGHTLLDDDDDRSNLEPYSPSSFSNQFLLHFSLRSLQNTYVIFFCFTKYVPNALVSLRKSFVFLCPFPPWLQIHTQKWNSKLRIPNQTN